MMGRWKRGEAWLPACDPVGEVGEVGSALGARAAFWLPESVLATGPRREEGSCGRRGGCMYLTFFRARDGRARRRGVCRRGKVCASAISGSVGTTVLFCADYFSRRPAPSLLLWRLSATSRRDLFCDWGLGSEARRCEVKFGCSLWEKMSR